MDAGLFFSPHEHGGIILQGAWSTRHDCQDLGDVDAILTNKGMQLHAGLHGGQAQITCRCSNGNIVTVFGIIPEVAPILPGCFDGSLEDLGQGVGTHAGEASSDNAAQMDQGSALAGHKACCNACDDADEFADEGPHAQEPCKA